VRIVAWGFFYVSEFNYFLQQKFVIMVLKLQLLDGGEKSVEG
jgi:hypothetical protein